MVADDHFDSEPTDPELMRLSCEHCGQFPRCVASDHSLADTCFACSITSHSIVWRNVWCRLCCHALSSSSWRRRRRRRRGGCVARQPIACSILISSSCPRASVRL